MKRLRLPSLTIAVLMSLVAAPAADAELTGDFDVALKNFKPSYGGYTMVFNARIYDATGAPPTHVQNAQIRLPRGTKIRSTWIGGKFICDTVTLEVRLDPTACRSARFATGSLVLDARPTLPNAITTNYYLFLAAPSIDDVPHGAVARIAVYVFGTSAFHDQVLYGTLFRDSGLFSYRMVLPTSITPIDPALHLSLAELHLTNTGLILKKSATGRHSARKIFWTSLPRCTKKGNNVFFEIDYQFGSAAPPIAEQRAVNCPRFARRR